PTIVKKGNDIIVELPGLKIDDFERVKRLIGQTAQLEFKIVDDGSDYMTKKILGIAQLKKDQYPGLEAQHDGWTQKDTGAPHSDGFLKAPDCKTIQKFLADLPPEDQPPGDHEIGFEESFARDEDGRQTTEKVCRGYYLYRRAQLTGEYVTDSDVNRDP